MARKSIESLYDVLFNMRKNLEDLVQNANGLVNDVNDYGGELGRVVKEQIQKYFIPAVEGLTKDENTPGSIIGIIRFMDSLPLAMTRVEPQVEQVAPVEQPAAQIQNPAGEEIPANTSFANPMEGATPEAPATPVEEPVEEAPAPVLESRSHKHFFSKAAEVTPKTSAKALKESIEDIPEIRSELADLGVKFQEDYPDYFGDNRDGSMFTYNNLWFVIFKNEDGYRLEVLKTDDAEQRTDDVWEEAGITKEELINIVKKLISHPELLEESAEAAPAEYNAEDEKDGESTSEPVDKAESEYDIIKEAVDMGFANSTFRRLLKDADMDKSGPFGDEETPVRSFGFHFYSQAADLKVRRWSPEDKWSIAARSDGEEDRYITGTGWNNLIDALIEDLDWIGLNELNPTDYYAPVLNESKLHESEEEGVAEAESVGETLAPSHWAVVRSSTMGSLLGEDLANLEAPTIGEFDTKEEAEKRAEELNKGVLPEEKELFGTEYKVSEIKQVEEKKPEEKK